MWVRWPRMTSLKPFRFGGGLFKVSSARQCTDRARRLEDLGYDTVMTGDHFRSQFDAALPTLLAAALATTRLRVSCTVFDNDYHNAVMLAKEVATADMLTDGRFEFGIGAGSDPVEYASAGLKFDAPGVRLDRLKESVQVIKGVWGDVPFSFDGQHYSIREFDLQPKPRQRPHPPIFIGGSGKRLLSWAAREGDIVGFLPRFRRDASKTEEHPASVAQKAEWVRQAAGDRLGTLELALHIWRVIITDQPRAAAANAIEQLGVGLTVDEMLESPYYLIGTVDYMVDRLQELRHLYGVSYILVFPEYTDAFAPVIARLAGIAAAAA
jgi:probable F420-dependent oxidoreductase